MNFKRAADFFGLQYLYKTGYDPESYIGFLERTWSQTPAGKNALPKVLNPYPSLPERVDNMKKEIAKILPPRDGAIVSSAEFQELKNHLRSRKLNEGCAPNGNPRKPSLRKRTDPYAPGAQDK